MAKRKISFDIDPVDFEKLKLVVQSTYMTQGEFLRKIVSEALDKFKNKVLSVYVVENNSLVRKAIDIEDYKIEFDDSALTKELMEDFSFVKSGFLIKDGVRTRFYAKGYVD